MATTPSVVPLPIVPSVEPLQTTVPGANCVISVTRVDGSFGPRSIDAVFTPPKAAAGIAFTAQGGMTQASVQCEFGTDIRQQDQVTIVEYNHVARTIGPFEVSYAVPVGVDAKAGVLAYLVGFSL